MLNNGGPRYKRSSLEKQMNQDVIWCVLILVVLCIIGAIGCQIWLASYPKLGEPFRSESISDATEAFLAFWTYVIILQVRHVVACNTSVIQRHVFADPHTALFVRNARDVQDRSGISHPQQRRFVRSSDEQTHPV